MSIIFYIIKRLLLIFPVMIGVVFITFVLGRLVPADPIHLILPREEMSEENIQRVREELGLDKPIYQQFAIYIRNIVTGDLGFSYHTGNTVVEDIAIRFPATFELTIISLVIMIIISIPLGVLAGIFRNGFIDHIARIFALLGQAMPAFWLGILLIFFFYYILGIFPPPMGRMPIGIPVNNITGLYILDGILTGNIEFIKAAVVQIILPVITVSFRGIAVLTRLTRSSMIEIINSDFIRSAKAQGLPSRMIYYKLALKNALISPITMIADRFGHLLSGIVVIEIVFSWPGIGMWAVNAAVASDYAPVQAFAMLAAALRIIIFLISDVICYSIDPRTVLFE